jgi:HAD superfamily hydrolase (TIGR01509 family)
VNRFAAAIFDMDGLLLDSEKIALRAFNETCMHFGLGDQSGVFMKCVGTNAALGIQVLQEGLEGKADYIHFGQLWDSKYFEATHGKPIPLKDGAIEILDHFASLEISTAVATSTSVARARQKLFDAGILDKFKLVVGGDQVEHGKPHPEIYLKAAHALHAAPKHCLALEDSENGVRSALGAGMAVIQIPDLVRPSPEIRALGHIVLNSLRDVITRPF